MKKVLLVLISVVLILSMSSPVLAGTEGTSGEIKTSYANLDDGIITSDPLVGEVYVEYSVASESYVVKIPGKITLTKKDDFVDSKVEVTQVTLVHGRYLNISVKSEHNWNMVLHKNNVPETSYRIPYSMGYTDYQWNNGIAAVPAGNSIVTSSGAPTSSSPSIILLQVHGNSNSEHMFNNLKFTMNDDAPSVGTYYDKLTFSVSVGGTAST